MAAINKPKIKIDRIRNQEHQPKWNKYDNSTALAFSGDLKYWTGYAKGKALF